MILPIAIHGPQLEKILDAANSFLLVAVGGPWVAIGDWPGRY